MKAPFIKLFVKDFAFDISGMTDAEVGRMMKAFIESYRSGNIPESFAKYSIFSALTLANANYSTTCERNKQNRVKSMGYNDQSSTTGQPLVNQSSTTLVNQNQNQNQNIEEDKKKEKTNKKETASHSLADSDFEKFWNSYSPIHTAKGNKQKARQQLDRIVSSKKTNFAEIMAGLERYMNHCKETNCYTKTVNTWLNQFGWSDEIEPTFAPAPVLTDAERFDLWVSDYKRFGIWDKPLPRPDSEMARGKYTTEQAAIARKHGYLNEVLI